MKYSIVEHNDSNFYSIRIDEGFYSNVIFTFGKVSIKESEDQSSATLSFTFKIEEPDRHTIEALENDPKFKNYIGDILSSILSESQAQIKTISNGEESSTHNS